MFHQNTQDADAWSDIDNVRQAAVAEGLGSGIAFYAHGQRLMIKGLLGPTENYDLSAVI